MQLHREPIVVLNLRVCNHISGIFLLAVVLAGGACHQ